MRTDLPEYLADKDILECVLGNTHRFKPEPLFAKTGVGYLAAAPLENHGQETEPSEALI